MRISAIDHINWNPDRRELQRFAFAMLVGFGALGVVAAWRSGSLGAAPVGLWLTGLALAIGGRAAYLGVYVMSGLIGAVISRVILLLMFVFVFAPLGVFLRLTGKDFLTSKPRPSMWERHQDTSNYYRQF